MQEKENMKSTCEDSSIFMNKTRYMEHILNYHIKTLAFYPGKLAKAPIFTKKISRLVPIQTPVLFSTPCHAFFITMSVAQFDCCKN